MNQYCGNCKLFINGDLPEWFNEEDKKNRGRCSVDWGGVIESVKDKLPRSFVIQALVYMKKDDGEGCSAWEDRE